MTDGAHARPTVSLGFTLPEAPAAGDRAQEYANKRLFLEAAGRLFVEHDLSAFEQFYAAEYVSRAPAGQNGHVSLA